MNRVKKVVVKVPPGVETGSRMRISGEGEAGAGRGQAGDLYVVIHVVPHDIFERHGDDVYCAVPVQFATAALGGEIDVPTLNGKALLKVPPGTQTGKLFRMRGKGIANIRGVGRGDQYVKVVIETPTKLSAEQKELLRRFAELSGVRTHPLYSSFLEKAKRFFSG